MLPEASDGGGGAVADFVDTGIRAFFGIIAGILAEQPPIIPYSGASQRLQAG